MARRGRGLYGSDSSGSRTKTGIAELIGTAILVYAGTAVAVAAILERPTAGPAYDSLAIALAFGLALAALVGALGHTSGAHLNPAVTIALASTGKFPRDHVPVYLVAQLLGAILGAIATWITFGGPAREEAFLAATFPAEGVSVFRALVVEAMITFVLVFVIMAVATDDRVPSAAIAPIAVGFALAIGVFIAGPVTGGAVNPARALGPMIVAGKLTAFWLYILGPILGAIAAAFVYDRVVGKADAPDVDDPPEQQQPTDGNGRGERVAARSAASTR